jgi:hypothetical protein
VKKFSELTGACRATYFNLKKELKQADQLHAFERVETPKRHLHSQPPVEPNIEEEVARAKDEDLRASSGQPDADQEPPHADEADVPAWCQFSNDPADYSSYSDYLDDWWKRPRPQSDEGHETHDLAPAVPEDLGTVDIAQLRRKLVEAIKREDYERAAKLRDEIQRRENQDRTDC